MSRDVSVSHDSSGLSLPKKKPQKKYYRQRAHSNPMSDHCLDYPVKPSLMDWSLYYSKLKEFKDQKVRFADVGCGYGGLLISLSPMFPDKLMLGLEIRVKVSDYVKDRIASLRSDNSEDYHNIACIRSNAMKYLPNFFSKGQLEKMFFLFPDPHFKKSKHKWRIINNTLLSEYAYVLSPQGLLYTITDVYDLHLWMTSKLNEHPLFQSCTPEEMASDIVVAKLYESTEEGQKVSRIDGQKWCSVYRRISRKNTNI